MLISYPKRLHGLQAQVLIVHFDFADLREGVFRAFALPLPDGDAMNVGVMRADYKEAEEEKDDKVAQPQQLSSPLRRAEDVRERKTSSYGRGQRITESAAHPHEEKEAKKDKGKESEERKIEC